MKALKMSVCWRSWIIKRTGPDCERSQTGGGQVSFKEVSAMYCRGEEIYLQPFAGYHSQATSRLSVAETAR
jgi:hypothetical protein